MLDGFHMGLLARFALVYRSHSYLCFASRYALVIRFSGWFMRRLCGWFMLIIKYSYSFPPLTIDDLFEKGKWFKKINVLIFLENMDDIHIYIEMYIYIYRWTSFTSPLVLPYKSVFVLLNDIYLLLISRVNTFKTFIYCLMFHASPLISVHPLKVSPFPSVTCTILLLLKHSD